MKLAELFESILNLRPLIAPLKGHDDKIVFERLSELKIQSPDLLNVIEELVINAREYGPKEIRIYCDLQGKELLFAIADHGPGIHETVPRNPNLSDTKSKNPAAIIRLALEEGITGTGVKGRGVGLYLLSDYIRRTESEAIIGSDGGVVRQEGTKFFEETTVKDWDGCIVCFKAQVR